MIGASQRHEIQGVPLGFVEPVTGGARSAAK
jgi:hypothetical protein